MSQSKCAILFSGGTDSTCVAALAAEEYTEIHLLTFYEFGTRKSPLPKANVLKLQKRFPQVKFVFKSISTDALVKHISYHKYLKYIWHYKWLALASCGYSSMSWHIRTLVYCKANQIDNVFDGLTKELMHFPGHMDGFNSLMIQLYESYSVSYSSKVRDWEVPDDIQLADKLIINQHGYLFPWEKRNKKRTTGEYLFAKGVFNSPNIKGTRQDLEMQHDCYPFVLYNIMAFWIYLGHMSYDEFAMKVTKMFTQKLEDLKPVVCDLINKGESSSYKGLIEYA